MKTNFKQALMPLAVVVLGVVGAFATNAKKQNQQVKTIETGYVTTNPSQPCNLAIECSNINGPVCTIMLDGVQHQAFGKLNPADVSCAKVLYRAL